MNWFKRVRAHISCRWASLCMDVGKRCDTCHENRGNRRGSYWLPSEAETARRNAEGGPPSDELPPGEHVSP